MEQSAHYIKVKPQASTNVSQYKAAQGNFLSFSLGAMWLICSRWNRVCGWCVPDEIVLMLVNT
jgi:hypothetical protein